MAFTWDNSSEEIYSKLYNVLGKQGKAIEGIRATLTRILETNLQTGDSQLIKEGEKFSDRLHLMVDLLDTKFKLIEKQLAQEKKLRLEQKADFERRISWLEGREQVRVDAEEAVRLKEEEERIAAERAAAEAEALRLAAEEQ